MGLVASLALEARPEVSPPRSDSAAVGRQFKKNASPSGATPGRGRFASQEGYGAFSVGTSQIENTIRYIRNQREHHQKQTFEEEYILFLKKNGMEYDERFVFG